MKKYKVIRVYEVQAGSPQDAMNRAGEQSLVFQKATPADESSTWTQAVGKQLAGKRR